MAAKCFVIALSASLLAVVLGIPNDLHMVGRQSYIGALCDNVSILSVSARLHKHIPIKHVWIEQRSV